MVAYGDGHYDIADESSFDYGMWELVQSLPTRLRDVVVLHYIEGYRTREIANLLGINQVTVRTRLNSARNILKRRLTDNE